ncbi:MAG: PEP/pyruvate-binding domain-containing protein, partial [Myxococcota bacterium]
ERNLLLLQAMVLVEELWVEDAALLARASLTRAQGLALTGTLLDAAEDLGMLSPREQASAQALLARARSGDASAYVAAIEDLRRVLDWMRARVGATLGLALLRYQAVEPKATLVTDDVLRSGIAVPLAQLLDRLQQDVERLSPRADRVIGLAGASGASVRGENAGLAVGRLRVLGPTDDASTLRRDELALLDELVAELPPVAGILTRGAGGSLSHVALLARNLGVPHATVSPALADVLRPLVGQELVLGVSAGRHVLLGPLSLLPDAERVRLQKPSAAATPFLTIDVGRLDLTTRRVLALADVSETDAGVRVGPKAAELGRLHRLFPTRVSDAAVLPFGLFVRHVDRSAPDGTPSPLARLRQAYERARSEPPERAEAMVLTELAQFRQAIATLPFDSGFVAAVQDGLRQLGPPGTLGVFVRSDTNVEDLKDFTGAGLNLTVPNRVKPITILAAIRDVWASPFSERAFRWRERILTNPEHVYPSVILHRTVPADVSGVLVTADIEHGDPTSWTVSVSEGVAAVVDGGSPETLVIDARGGRRLIASPRTVTQKRIPKPPGEGVRIEQTSGREPLLTDDMVRLLTELVGEVRAKMPATSAPWDVEFGFVGRRLYLMQIRPLRTAHAPVLEPTLAAMDASAVLAAGPISLEEALP